jgi:hypothetical protein
MFLLRLFLCVFMFAQPACSQKNDKPVLLMNASVHKGNGEVIENAALAFKDEKITLLADARVIRLDMTAFEVVEAYGLHIYPAALLDSLPRHAADMYYIRLDGNAPSVLLATDSLQTDIPIVLLQEGAEATFVVTEQLLEEEEIDIRYLVVKGKLKRENNLSLQLLRADQ